MNGNQRLGLLAIMLLSLALAGCGGGGGGGVVSTPPLPVELNAPKAYTPTNLSPSTSFNNSMQSGNFATLAVLEDYQDMLTNDKHTYTHDNTISNAYISYDAASNSYALNYTGSGGTATPGKFNAPTGPDVTVTANGVPDPTEVGYSQYSCFTSGCYGNGATITHTGAGPFVYTYTAFALLSTSSASSIGGATSRTLDTVFGVLTPASAVPRTGNATYALDLMGVYHGTGTGKVDFGAATYAFTGTLDSTGFNSGSYSSAFTGTFSSTGTLSGSGNGFSGYIDVATKLVANGGPNDPTTDNWTYRGVLGGAFFGPQAQELGSVFTAPAVSHTSTNPANASVPPVGLPAFSGAILGHK